MSDTDRTTHDTTGTATHRAASTGAGLPATLRPRPAGAAREPRPERDAADP
ncbi:MAG: hypothetical protein JWR66_256, partial [Modestobacter sp.]|nr:hypothetical protein [Modestobacter sp.]